MSELRFTEDHEWLRTEADGSVTVGITAFAQNALGDVVFVQLPELQSYDKGAEAATVESVKAASGVYMPLDGEVVEVNPALDEQPGTGQRRSAGRRLVLPLQAKRRLRCRPTAGSGRLRPPDQSQRRSLRSADMTQVLVNVSTDNEFIARHIGPRAGDEQAMLDSLGFDSLEALSASVIPDSIKGTSVLGLPDGLSEADALAVIKAIAGKNQVFKTYIGQGYYGTHTPAPILRNMLENPAWYTAYTPYQPEISQGRLEALLNFQTMISDLTGLEIANASLLDEATAAAEAMTCLQAPGEDKGSHAFFVSGALPSADPRRGAHPRRAAGHRRGGRRRVATDRASSADSSARCCNTRPPTATCADLTATARRCPCSRRAGRGRRRPAGADPADAAGRVRRRRRGRQRPALRRADGLRRPARGVLRHQGCVQARHAGPSGRRVDRPLGQAGLCAWPCRPASSTSAARRPPATSAPRRCCWPTWPAMYAVYHGPEGPDADRPARASADRDPGAAACEQLGFTVEHARFFDTVDRRDRPTPLPSCMTAARAAAHQPAHDRRRAHRACRSTKPRRRPTSRPCGRCSPSGESAAGLRRARRRRGATPSRRAARTSRRFLTPPGVQHATTPKPRCCATCAAWPTRTWRSIAP